MIIKPAEKKINPIEFKINPVEFKINPHYCPEKIRYYLIKQFNFNDLRR